MYITDFEKFQFLLKFLLL